MVNPYQAPLHAPQRANRLATLGLTRPELAFLAALTCVSFATHRWHREIHQFFNISSGVSGFVLEACMLGTLGCWLVTRRTDAYPAKRVWAVLLGSASAAAIALASCWGLLFAGQPPRAAVVPASVLVAMVITAYMSSDAE